MQVRKKRDKKKQLFGIKLKLMCSFLVPIIFIISLGVCSYSFAEKSIISNYETTGQTSLSMMHKYFNIGFETAQTKAIQFNANDDIKMYFSGHYKNDAVKEGNKREEINEYIANTMLVSDMIQNVGIISGNAKGIWMGEVIGTDTYKEFIESDEGKQALEQKNIWIGKHPFVDQKVAKKSSDYCLSLIKRLVGVNYKDVGYIIVDIKSDFVKNTLKEANFGEGSIVGFITQDGKEVFNQEFEDDFSIKDEAFYKQILAGEEENGCKYITYKGKQYLLLYEKLLEQNVTLCALVDKTVLLEQAQKVKSITVIITIIASIIASFIGIILSISIERKIHKANKVLEEVAKGNLKQEFSYKSKDEFKIKKYTLRLDMG